MLGLDISPIAPTIFFGFYYGREIWRLLRITHERDRSYRFIVTAHSG